MKTTALILFASCLSLWGQTSNLDTNLDMDTALRDEILRRAVRQFGTNDEPPAPAAATTNTAAPVVAATPSVVPPAVTPSNPVPAVTPPSTRLTLPVTSTPATAVATATNALPAVTPTNPVATTVVPAVVPVPVPVTPAAVPPATVPTAAAPPPARVPGSRPQMPGMMPRPLAGPGAVATAPPETGAAPVEPADQKMDFPLIDLPTFLGVYAGVKGRTVLHGQLPSANISLQTQKPLTRRELIQAMDTVLAMNNITMVDQGSNFVQAVTAAEAASTAPEFSKRDPSELPDAMQYISQIVQLKFVKPAEVAPLLVPFAKIPGNIYPIEGTQMLIIRDYAVNVKRMMEFIKQVDVILPTEYEQEIIPIKYAKVADIASALGSLGAGAGASIGTSSSGGRGGGRAGLGGAGGYSAGTSLGGAVGPGGAASPFGGANALGGARGAVPPSLASRLQGIARQAGGGGAGDIQLFTGATKIVADERSHSLLVLAGHQDMLMIKSIVKKLDVVLAQVLIEAVIMEVNLDDELNLGVSYLQTTPSTGNYLSGIGALNNGSFLNNASFVGSGTNGIGSLPGGFSYLTHFGGDFDATVTAVATDSRINVLSKPQIQTSDGVAASFKVGDTIPYVTGTFFGGYSGGSSSQYQQTFVGIDLEVTPQINSEGLVVMDISQDIEQLGPSTTIDGNAVPTTTQRSAASTVSVRDGDTIILGGFISSTKSRSHSGVPLLKDIPVLGYLFRSSSDSTKRVELIVLIHPKVLPTPEAAAVAATHERNNLPGIKAAQAEAQIDENKRLKKADLIKVPDIRP